MNKNECIIFKEWKGRGNREKGKGKGKRRRHTEVLLLKAAINKGVFPSLVGPLMSTPHDKRCLKKKKKKKKKRER